MYKTTAILLLTIALTSAMESATIPAEVLDLIFGPAATRINRDTIADALVGDIWLKRYAEAGGKCTFLKIEGTCIPYEQCNYFQLPDAEGLGQADVAVESIQACKNIFEVCCPKEAIFSTAEPK